MRTAGLGRLYRWRACYSASSAGAPVVLLLLEARQDPQGPQAPVGREGLPRREDPQGPQAPVGRQGLPRREDLVVQQGLGAQEVQGVLAPPALALSTMPAELPI
jgi:hypothetical protein